MISKLITVIVMIMLAFAGQPCFAVAATKHSTKPVKAAKKVKAIKTAKTAKSAKIKKSGKHRPSTKSHTTKQKKKTSRLIHKKPVEKKVKRTHNRRAAQTSSQPVLLRPMINTSNISQSHLPAYSLSSIEKNLVNFVRKTVESIRYTAYKLGGTRIDTSQGIYVVDCSTYVDHILKSVYPRAYTSLTSFSGTEKPTTDDFYQYFTNLSEKSRHWNMIDDVEELRPGDVLVFRSKNKYGNEVGGHVMVVMDKPTREGNTFLVRVADSASSGHSKDTRMPKVSGIGIGTISLKVNPNTFQPYAYAWKAGSRWESNVNFAMARPINLS